MRTEKEPLPFAGTYLNVLPCMKKKIFSCAEENVKVVHAFNIGCMNFLDEPRSKSVLEMNNVDAWKETNWR